VSRQAAAHVEIRKDSDGGLVGSASFPTPVAGYQQLLGWMQAAGTVARVGMEGTGSYGAGICRHLSVAGVEGGG
jgi:transposase